MRQLGNLTFTWTPPNLAISKSRVRAAIYWEVRQLPEPLTLDTVRTAVERAVQRLVDETAIERVTITGTIDL